MVPYTHGENTPGQTRLRLVQQIAQMASAVMTLLMYAFHGQLADGEKLLVSGQDS